MLTEYDLILRRLDRISKLAKERQILFSSTPLSGEVPCCYVFGIDYTTGNFYYKDADGNWTLSVSGGGGGGLFDAIVAFDVNTDPNTPGTTFDPDNQALETVLYVSTIDFSQWIYYSGAYHSYVSPFWTLKGNAGTTPGTNFIGTTDNKGLMFKTNNIQSGYIDLVKVNTSFGKNALVANTLGIGSNAFGELALHSQTTGSNNNAFGYNALGSVTTNSRNSGFGSGVMTTGNGSDNCAFGYAALANGSGSSNCVFGSQSMNVNTGSQNAAFGYGALNTNGAGTSNSAFGLNSLSTNTTGSNNAGFGYYAGKYSTTASNQIFINTLDRVNYTGDQTASPIYIQQNSTVSSQNIYLNGEIYHPYLTNLSTQDRLVGVLNSSGRLGNITLGAGLTLSSGVLNTSGAATAISALTAALGTNSISNNTYNQTWWWDGMRTGSSLTLRAGASANTTTGSIKVLEIISDNVQVSNGHTVDGLNIAVSNTSGPSSTNTKRGIASIITSGAGAGTTATNIGGYFSASGGDLNYGIIVPSTGGSVGIGTSAPTDKLHVSGTTRFGTVGSVSGVIKFSGSTSGTVTLQPAAAAGTWTLTLPTTDGNAGEFLQTDGSGVCIWASGSSLTVGTSTITSGTNTKVLYNNSGVLGEYTVSGTGNVAMTASPILTGTPAAPTAVTGTNTTQLATTAFVQQELTANTVYFTSEFDGTGTSGDPISLAVDTAAGTYTPTLTNTTNVTSSTPAITHYTRVGNQVNVTGSVSVTTTAGAATVLGISLPISSNFAATTDAAGLGSAVSLNANSLRIEANATTDVAELKFSTTTNLTITIFFNFMYTII